MGGMLSPEQERQVNSVNTVMVSTLCNYNLVAISSQISAAVPLYFPARSCQSLKAMGFNCNFCLAIMCACLIYRVCNVHKGSEDVASGEALAVSWGPACSFN